MSKRKKETQKRYGYRKGFSAPVDPQTCGEELARIEREHGQVRPRTTWEENRDDDAPLHGCFEWDDETAAALHRDDQARHLIRNVVLIDSEDGDTENVTKIAYISVQREDDEKQGYLSSEVVMAAPDLRKQAVDMAKAQLMGLRRRYEHLTELSEVWAAIDRAAG